MKDEVELNLSSRIDLGKEYDQLEDSVFVVGGEAGRNQAIEEFHNIDVVSSDIDLMVANVTPEELLERGFKHVMSDDAEKPVFIDKDGREVSIPREDISTGDSHNNFEFNIIDPSIATEKQVRKDLKRRDLTMNAMAVRLTDNTLVDPFGGIQDIKNKTIRHVSPAFSNDPLRSIRAARYAARFNFSIHPKTTEFILQTKDKIPSLPESRFGRELMKTLRQTHSPKIFFEVLSDLDILKIAYPEIQTLKSKNVFDKTLQSMNEFSSSIKQMFLALTYHVEHPEQMRKRLGISSDYKQLTRITRKTPTDIHNENELLSIADTINNTDVTTENITDIINSQTEYNHQEIKNRLSISHESIQEIDAKTIKKEFRITDKNIGNTISGEKFGNLIQEKRKQFIKNNVQ